MPETGSKRGVLASLSGGISPFELNWQFDKAQLPLNISFPPDTDSILGACPGLERIDTVGFSLPY